MTRRDRIYEAIVEWTTGEWEMEDVDSLTDRVNAALGPDPDDIIARLETDGWTVSTEAFAAAQKDDGLSPIGNITDYIEARGPTTTAALTALEAKVNGDA
jgi:hypothetical protein